MVRATSARRTTRDDIPIAQRSKPRRAKTSGGALFFACLMLFAGTGVSVILGGPELLARFNQPLELDNILDRPSADGRLLGHFPYQEAAFEDLLEAQSGIELHIDAADALHSMQAAAAAEGINLRLLSGFRSHQLQERIFFDVKSERNQTAAERAKVSAPPGYSEHSTGYAIDLGDGSAPETNLSVEFENTPSFRWLQDHAASYHFTLSFPIDNQQGVSYEPWHWRFEGSAEALRQFEAARQFAKAS